MRSFVVGAALIALLGTACTIQAGDPQPAGAGNLSQTSLAPGREPVAAVVERVLPAVVNVTTDVFRSDGLSAEESQGVGTGFIVRADGVIVTNCHVVEGASRITVFTSDEDPESYEARVIGGDCLSDLAVLKIDETGLPTVALGSSGGLSLGQRVVAIGYALALEGGPSVTTGVVSSLDRTIQAQDPGCQSCPNGVRTYSNVIQTDAAINHGNSGGPLVDMSGQVVGINSAGNDAAENIGFAIAIDSVEAAISQAISEPLAATAYLGVSTATVDASMALQLDLTVDSGAYVLATTTDGPAAGAGITQGDTIVSVDGSGVASSIDLGQVLDGLDPGQTVAVEVVAISGEVRSVQVTLGTRPLPTDLP